MTVKKRKGGKALRLQRLDSISLDKTYYTSEGYLVDHPIVTTCGVFEYKNEDGSTRRELRLPEHVFDKKSLESYKGKPIIITHAAGDVDKENVRREQIGTIMSAGYRDGDNVRCEIIIHDTNTLKRCGLRELSLGYSLDTEEMPGVWQGEEYDCIQKNIEINHLALVAEARAGDTARLNIDSKDGKTQILKGGKAMMKNRQNTKGRRADEVDTFPLKNWKRRLRYSRRSRRQPRRQAKAWTKTMICRQREQKKAKTLSNRCGRISTAGIQKERA